MGMPVPLDFSKFTVAPSLQQCFIDKDTGGPLSLGTLTSYRNSDRTNTGLKPLYIYSGTPTPTYVPLPNPLPLDMNGCITDTSGNLIVPYYYLVDSNGNPDSYYLVVKSASNVVQQTVENYPQIGGNANETVIDSSLNYCENGQFLVHFSVNDDDTISDVETPLAPPHWNFRVSPNFTSTNIITFDRYGTPINNPEADPRYALTVNVTVASGAESEKLLYYAYPDVNMFQGQTITFQFEGISNNGANTDLSLVLTQNFGTGGSPSPTQQFILTTFTLTPTLTKFNFSFVVPSTIGMVMGINNDDALEIGLRYPLNVVSNTTVVDFIHTPGMLTNIIYPPVSQFQVMSRAVAGSIDIPDPGGADYGSTLILGNSIQRSTKHIGLVWGTFDKRNYIPAGNFDSNPWQKWVTGSTHTGSTSNENIAADSFLVAWQNTVSLQFSINKSSDAPTFDEANYYTGKSLEIFINNGRGAAGSDDYLMILNTIEGQDFIPFAQKNFILAFWAKSNITGTYCISLVNLTADQAYVTEYEITDANVWQLITLPFPPTPSTGAWNYGTGPGLQVRWAFAPVNASRTAQFTNQWYQPSTSTAPIATANQVNLPQTTDNFFRLALIGLYAGTVYSGFTEPSTPELLNYCFRRFEKSYAPGIAIGSTTGANTSAFRFEFTTNGNDTYYFRENFFSQKSQNATLQTLTFYDFNGNLNQWTNQAASTVFPLDQEFFDNRGYRVRLNVASSNFSNVWGHWYVESDYDVIGT